MAVYNLDNINESMHEEEIEESNVLDNMLEACEYMIDILDESARTKYVEMKAKQAKEYQDKYNNTPDTETKTVDKDIKLPFGYSLKGSKTTTVDNRKEKKDLLKKHYDAEKTAAKYAGTYEDYGPKGIKDSDGNTVIARWSNGNTSVESIHKAGKPENRYGDGAHYKKDSYQPTTKRIDYEAMAKSKAGKDAFNKDFGGPDGYDYIGSKMPAYSRNSKTGNTHDMMENENGKKLHQDYMKSHIKSHLEQIEKNKEDKKKAVKEACLYILSKLDDIE